MEKSLADAGDRNEPASSAASLQPIQAAKSSKQLRDLQSRPEKLDASHQAFMPLSMPGSTQLPQQYPFLAQRPSSLRCTSDTVPEFPAHLTSMESISSESSTSDTVPEFPAHLTSMESVSSESSQTEIPTFHGLPSSAASSQQSQQMSSSSSSSLLQRPQNTAANSGTYTCTASSCSLRFDTAANLQKHRRDAHPRSLPPRISHPPTTRLTSAENPITNTQEDHVITSRGDIMRNNKKSTTWEPVESSSAPIGLIGGYDPTGLVTSNNNAIQSTLGTPDCLPLSADSAYALSGQESAKSANLDGEASTRFQMESRRWRPTYENGALPDSSPLEQRLSNSSDDQGAQHAASSLSPDKLGKGHPPEATGSQGNKIFRERLQAARYSHSNTRPTSPVTHELSEPSPFRPESPYSSYSFTSSPSGPSHNEPPRTISPKESFLDYDSPADEAILPLFNEDTQKKLRLPVSTSDQMPQVSTQPVPNSHPRQQAGLHICERINPSTGKPCRTVFSRPYDLTRHEDTIHNSRKQKVRCHLCTEEKAFTRNDALTRHMRVVHPDVDFPGKKKRRAVDGVLGSPTHSTPTEPPIGKIDDERKQRVRRYQRIDHDKPDVPARLTSIESSKADHYTMQQQEGHNQRVKNASRQWSPPRAAMNTRDGIPKFDRTMSDIYADALFDSPVPRLIKKS